MFGFFLIKIMLKVQFDAKKMQIFGSKKILLKKKLFKTTSIIGKCVVLFPWYLF